MKRRGPGVQTNNNQYGVFSRGAKKRKSSIGGETYAPGRKGDPQLYVVGKKKIGKPIIKIIISKKSSNY